MAEILAANQITIAKVLDGEMSAEQIAQLNQASEDASQAKTDVANLEIGGRNYVVKKDSFSATVNGITVDYDGEVYHVYGTNTETGVNYSIENFVQRANVFEPGAVYTISTTTPLPSGLYLGINTRNSIGTEIMAASNSYFFGDGSKTSNTFTCIQDTSGYLNGFFGIEASCRTIDVTFKIKLEKGNKATDWTPAPEDVDAGINNATKVATNFIGYDSTNGLIIGNKTSGTWSGYRSQILPGSFNILDASSTVLASFGTTTVIGEEAKANMHLTFNNFSMADKDGTTLFKVGDNRNAEGIATVKHTAMVSVDSTGSATVTVDTYILSIISVYADSVQLSNSSYSFSQKNVTINNLTANSQTSIEITYTTDDSSLYLTFGNRDSSGKIGRYSVAEGQYIIASGQCSHAEGSHTEASGTNSHAEGNGTNATGRCSHAEGIFSTASGTDSHAEGYDTKASGDDSHAEGYSSKASGEYSHAEGRYSEASGEGSHAGGGWTVADGDYMTAIGKLNTKNSGKAFVIGNGTSDTARSDAFTVDWSGNTVMKGGLTLGTALSIANGGTNATSLAVAQENLGIKANSERIAAIATDLNVQKSRIDTFTSLPEGSTSGNAELADIRVGADGTTYDTAGNAVRGQIDELKSDLAVEQDNGLFHRYLTWEHGGIDNSTGENNNDGSLVRSRMTEYLLCADYENITNDSGVVGYIIYYNSDKSFASASLIDINGYLAIDKSYVYFRLDLRGAIEKTRLVKVYQLLNTLGTMKNTLNNFMFNSLSPTMFEQGHLQNNSGSESFSKAYIRTGFVAVNPKTTIGIKNNSNANYYYSIHQYDKDKNWISALALAYTQENNEVVTASNCYYIRMEVFKNGYGNLTPSDIDNTSIYFKWGGNGDEIPSYWSTAVAECETSINGNLSANDDTAGFAFVTDTHIGNNAGYSGLLMDKVMKDCHIPICFHGGDAVSGAGIVSKDNIIADIVKDFAQFAGVESRCLRAIGNHDPVYGVSANYDSNLSNGEINHYYHGIDREKDLQIYGDEKGYFYRDISKDKMRYIMLDMIYYDSQIDTDGIVTGANKMYYYKFGAVQLNWLADVLANTPGGYGVVVCSHMSPVALSELQTLSSDWAGDVPVDYLQARRICSAYASKIGYVFNGGIAEDLVPETYDINVDFTNAKGDFVCWIGGHTHKDYILALDGIKIIGTANDSKAVSSNASAYAPSKTAGTNTEQIIDFFCIDKTNRTVKVVRLGAYLEANGKVRVFTY